MCTRGGITYINDSKGTNPDSTVKAIQTMTKPTVLILGGYDKGGSFDMVFMDIYMNGISVTETAARMREKDCRCVLIFLTTSMEHMPEAFFVSCI